MKDSTGLFQGSAIVILKMFEVSASISHEVERMRKYSPGSKSTMNELLLDSIESIQLLSLTL